MYGYLNLYYLKTFEQHCTYEITLLSTDIYFFCTKSYMTLNITDLTRHWALRFRDKYYPNYTCLTSEKLRKNDRLLE